MSSLGVPRGALRQNSTGAESQSVPVATTNWLELVRARHEARIRQTLVDWCAESAGSRGIPILTSYQQSNLHERVVDMFVELGEARLLNLLAQGLSPQQYDLDSEHLIEIVASEAQSRWKTLTTRYHLKADASEIGADPDIDVQQGVLNQLIRVAERYKLKAWSDLEKRLEAECGPTTSVLSNTAMASSAPSVSAIHPRPASRSLAQKIEGLRIDKGLSVEKLAELAKVDKKSLLGISKGTRPHPRTLKKIADALGITPTELQPDVRDPTLPS